MSQVESSFIKWFAGIAGTLIIAITLGSFSFYNSVNKVNAANEVRFQYIQQDISDIKADLKEIKNK